MSVSEIEQLVITESVIPKQHKIDAMAEITCGALSGMIGKLVEFPFDTIKVRLQAAHHSTPISTLQMIRYTYHNEGMVNGFYKGLKAPLMGACAETAVLFSSYNYASSLFMNKLNYSEQNLPFWTKCVSGGFAGVIASFVLTPVELVKCQLQVANLSSSAEHKSVSYVSLIKRILTQEKGVFGLWNGLSSTLVREAVGTSIWFGTYEYVSHQFKTHKPTSINEDVQLLISGAMAGITFNFSVFPVDTIKSNIQTYDILNPNKKHIGFLEFTKMLLARPGGITNLYNGLAITLIRCVPANALIFYSYELLKRNF
ncbi:hypothetical protein G9P44_001519 [Scheffersomyces stipitis]|nr:hypothetical protein G9P44_001519 [Scheffersomyces stipitis]